MGPAHYHTRETGPDLSANTAAFEEELGQYRRGDAAIPAQIAAARLFLSARSPVRGGAGLLLLVGRAARPPDSARLVLNPPSELVNLFSIFTLVYQTNLDE